MVIKFGKNSCVLCVVSCGLLCKLFHYKDRNSIEFFPDLRSKERRENSLSHLSRFVFFFKWCSPGDLLGGGWVTSSSTEVSDALASVEREEYNDRLRGGSVIKASRNERKSSSSFSGGRRGKESTGGKATFARGPERKPGRSAGSSWSRAGACGESSLKRWLSLPVLGLRTRAVVRL